MRIKKHILIALSFFIFTDVAFCNLPEPSLLLNNMLRAMEGVKTCAFHLKVIEMYDGKAHENKHKVKMQSNPLKAYIYCVEPNPGAEALYVEGVNNNKVLVNPNRFPYFNVSFGVNSMMLRKEHPYSLAQLGYTYILPLLKAYIAREGLPFYDLLSCNREVEFNGKKYYLLEINNPKFGYTSYKAGKNETVASIASKLLVNDKMILVHNDFLKDYGIVKEGTILKVPNSFAKKIELYVDKETMLPMVQVVYNDEGLYARIEFTSFQLNPVFDPGEFSSDYHGYHF